MSNLGSPDDDVVSFFWMLAKNVPLFTFIEKEARGLAARRNGRLYMVTESTWGKYMEQQRSQDAFEL